MWYFGVMLEANIHQEGRNPLSQRCSTTLDTTVRKAQLGDVGELCDLLAKCDAWLQGRGLGHWRGAHPREVVAEFIINADVFVLSRCDAAVGMIKLAYTAPSYWKPGDFGEKKDGTRVIAYISKLAVLPELHRHGYGSELMGFAESSACCSGASMIRLDATSLDVDLTQFYLHRGYEIVSHRVVPGPGITADNPTNFYQKTLTHQAAVQ